MAGSNSQNGRESQWKVVWKDIIYTVQLIWCTYMAICLSDRVINACLCSTSMELRVYIVLSTCTIKESLGEECQWC